MAGPVTTEESTLRKLLPRLLLSLALGGVFAWLIARGGVPLLPSLDELRSVDPQLLGISSAEAA